MSGSLTPNFVDLRWEKSNEIWYQLHVGTVSQSDATAGKSQNRELQRTVTFFPSRILACGLLQSIFILPRWSRSQSFRRLEHLVQKWQQKKLFKNCHFHLFFKFSQNFRWKNKKKICFFPCYLVQKMSLFTMQLSDFILQPWLTRFFHPSEIKK